MKTSKPIKKAVTNARSSFVHPKANRSDERKCYTCNRPGHLAKECPRNKGNISNQTTQVKGKPWCSYHKLNSHSSETCWALHPELRPSSSKERAAQSVRQAKVVPAKAGHSLNDKLKPALLSTMQATQSGASQTMDSYYTEEVFNGGTNDLAELFTVAAGAATKERRSAETQGLRRVTQADLPLSFLPYLDDTDVPAVADRRAPAPKPTPVVVEDDLGRFTPRRYRAPRVGKVYGGEDLMCEESLDAMDFSHDPSDKSDREEMPESFGYLSEGDPNYQGVLEFVMPVPLPETRSVLGNGSKEEKESARPIRNLEESEMPQEGHPSDPWKDEAQEVLENLPTGDNLSLTNGKELAKDIPVNVRQKIDNLASGTTRGRMDGPPEGGVVAGEKREGGKSVSLVGQQSTFDKSMQGTTFATVVQEDPNTEPVLYSYTVGRDDHIRDPAPTDWTVQDRTKYHQTELQALLGGANTSRHTVGC
jgi:hypothetical protein